MMHDNSDVAKYHNEILHGTEEIIWWILTCRNAQRYNDRDKDCDVTRNIMQTKPNRNSIELQLFGELYYRIQ